LITPYPSRSIASQYGRRHESFTGNGHLYLFESADVAVQLGLKLIAFWRQRRPYLTADASHDLPIRAGCHFGECRREAVETGFRGSALHRANASVRRSSQLIAWRPTSIPLLEADPRDIN